MKVEKGKARPTLKGQKALQKILAAFQDIPRRVFEQQSGIHRFLF
jgi:hypothetical protein